MLKYPSLVTKPDLASPVTWFRRLPFPPFINQLLRFSFSFVVDYTLWYFVDFICKLCSFSTEVEEGRKRTIAAKILRDCLQVRIDEAASLWTQVRSRLPPIEYRVENQVDRCRTDS